MAPKELFVKPLTEGHVKNNQTKKLSDIKKEAILKPPPATSKKKK